MPARDLALLTETALSAGKIAMRFWRQPLKSWDKGGSHGPVSEADIAVNEMLAERLCAARPDYGWLSEETEDGPGRLAAERVFIIDPIDGTRAFIAGEETFAHSLAVAEAGRVIAAAVYLPALDRLYTACEGGPALCDGMQVRASELAGIEGAHLLTTRPNLEPEHWPGGVPDLKRSFRASLAYRLCLVAEGRFDGVLSLRDAWEWDIAAGALIAGQAGATASDRWDRPLVFNAKVPRAPGVVVAAPGLHAALVARLRPA